MIESIILIGFLCFLIFVSAYFANRKIPMVEKRQMRECDKKELCSILVEKVKSMRSYQNGGIGIKSSFLYREIVRTNKIIENKIAGKIPLQESEKWFYENFYLVYRYVYGNGDDMSRLPHIDDEPRIIKIARIIVDNSMGDLNPQRIKFIMENLKGVFSLTFGELRAFNYAIAYAVIEEIYILAKRLNYHNECKSLANNGKLNKKYITRDVYLYFLFNSGKLSDNAKLNLKKAGIEEKAVNLNYNSVLMRNTLMAETLFGALRNVNAFVPMSDSVSYLGAYQIINEYCSLENISIESLIEYFTKIEKLSKQCKVSEDYVAQKLIEASKITNKDVSVILFDYGAQLKRYIKNNKTFKIKTKSRIFELVYSLAIILISVGISFVIGYFGGVFFGLISFIPVFFVTENIINYLLSHKKNGYKSLKMNYKHIPFEYSTMVVISEFIGSIEQMKESIFKATTVLESNRDENISVSILVDTKGGDLPVSDLDSQIIDYLSKQSLDKHLNVFIRKKSFTGKKFIAKERKRGAIMALSKFLISREDFEFLYIHNKNFESPTFIVTLDADNTVLPGEIFSLINSMVHPYNKKYDLLSMQCRNSLYSIKTLYSLRFIHESGYENYPNYTGLYFKLFGNEIFCGKGIFRLRRMFNKLEEIIPSQKILSHDILEGSILNTGGAGMCFEDAPKSFISDRERRKRWQRGDIQLLPFLFVCWKNDKKERYRSGISYLNKFIIFKNILSVFKEICLFSAIIVGLCGFQLGLFISLGVFLAPYIINEIKILRQITINAKMSHILKCTLKNFVLMTEDFFMLGYYAISNLWLICTTFLKMLLRKNLLEWKTYYSSQNSGNIFSYAKEFGIPFLVTTAVTAVLFAIGFSAILLPVYQLCSFCVYVLIFCLSEIKFGERKQPNANEKKFLLEIAQSTYKYFCFMRKNNGMIGDNLQIKPYKGESKTTSPTNLGFAMLSEICAYKLNFASGEECIYNITKILDTLESLPKWYGNFYNWYFTENGMPANKFVSSVDNGNLIVMLLAVKEFFEEMGDSTGKLKSELLIRGFKLNKLYDNSKKLFYIGFDGEKYSGHYDLLASEARILSMVFIALYNDYEHYNCLEKDYTHLYGNTLLSWSGTMFEMLMADLFFDTPRFSALNESSKNNVKCQMKNRYGNGIWGTSESGYYAFDGEMKYQYKAFGLSEVSLCNETNKEVISPYSSALALRYAPKEVIENFKKLKEYGMYFEYGFYESVDFSKGEKIVYSAMTHHQGMILAAITNYLCNDVLHLILNRSAKIYGILNYFNDIQPIKRYMHKKQEKHRKYIKIYNNYYKKIDKIEQYMESAGLTDSQYRVICNAFGGSRSYNNGIAINKIGEIYEEESGMFFYARSSGGKWHSPTYLPLCEHIEKHSFSYTGDEIFYTSEYGLNEEITLLPSMTGEIRTLKADSSYRTVAFYFHPLIDNYDNYISHPTFADMFIRIRKLSDNMITIVKKRHGEETEKNCLAVKVEGVKNIRWICDRQRFIGTGNSLKNPDILLEKNINGDILGDTVMPCVGFVAEFSGNENVCRVAVIYGNNEIKAEQYIASLPADMYKYARQFSQCGLICEYTQSLLGGLVWGKYSNRILNNVIESGDREAFLNYTNGKKVILYTFDENEIENFYKICDVVCELRLLGIDVKLTVYTQKRLNKNMENNLLRILKNKQIETYAFVSGICDEKYRSFLMISSDLRFLPFKLVPNKIFEAENSKLKICGVIEKPELAYQTGEGGFDSFGRYVLTGKPKLPYSDIIGEKYGGIISNSEGNGYYYFNNSREDKCVRFDNDPVSSNGGEKMYVKTIQGYIPLLGGSGESRYTVIDKGAYIHYVNHDGISVRTTQTVICEGRVKVSEIKILKPIGEYLEFLYAFYPSADWRYSPEFITFSVNTDVLTINNVINGKKYYVKIIGVEQKNLTVSDDKEQLPYFEYYCKDSEEKIYIASSCDLSILHSLNETNIMLTASKTMEYFKEFEDIDVISKEKSIGYLVSYLPYQIVSSRLNARAGFYQIGGAIGFRDQLQDCMSLFSKPDILKEQIEKCCVHQYEEGDVMHWWHEPNYGLRTRISDDKLFLPLAVCEYLKISGDLKFLERELPYLRSNELLPTEKDRFENPPQTEYSESIFKHCLKAVRSSLRYGEHHLLIMGSGDWNDGMDFICSQGRGESVFNSMLCYQVLNEFSAYCPDDLKNEMLTIAGELKIAINKFAFDEDRYMRLFSDDGKWLGSSRSKELQLDLLVQAYAVISGVADGERAAICLKTAENLIDQKAGIIKLLYPPLSSESYLGYISDYPEGMRENGGQYTHAAMWYLIALTLIGKQDFAFELFQMINPVEKCSDKEKSDRYMGEPYVLSGDVYSNKDNYGRVGWTWYTGSAGWAYKLITEYFFGLKKRGDFLYIEPKLPKKLENSTVVFKYENSTYYIEYKTGLCSKITMDGERVEKIPLKPNLRCKITVETGFRE